MDNAGASGPGSPRTGLRPWDGDHSPLGTWESTNLMRANSERLAPPQVVADNYSLLAHNRSNQKAMPLPIFEN